MTLSHCGETGDITLAFTAFELYNLSTILKRPCRDDEEPFGMTDWRTCAAALFHSAAALSELTMESVDGAKTADDCIVNGAGRAFGFFTHKE